MQAIELHGAKAAGRVAVVDDAEFDRLVGYRFHVAERDCGRIGWGPYAVTSALTPDGRRVTMSMHRMITGYAMTDHRDRYGLHNWGDNLREADPEHNAWNRSPSPDFTSRWKGVSWAGGKWRAQIGSQGRSIHLGLYVTESAAARAYNDAAWLLWGEWACLNEIPRLARHQVLTLF